MRKCFIVALLVVMALVFACKANAGSVCFWHNCPQADKVAAGAVVPDWEIIPNINFNGETNYVFRPTKWGGSGFALGVSSTLISYRDYFTVDAKYVNMINGTSAQMAGLGVAASLPGLLKSIGCKWPLGNFTTFKVGPEGLMDINHNFRPYFGVYATIIQVQF